MNRSSRIYVAGAFGMLGKAVVRALRRRNFSEPLAPFGIDLTDQDHTSWLFEKYRPEYVFLLAGKVGGILANKTYPVDFIDTNLAITINVLRAARDFGVSKLVYVACSCIYPKDCPQPMKEEYLGTGELEPTSAPFAMAKLAGISMCRAYSDQYGSCFIPAILPNLYGPGDNYDPDNSHFMAALIRKFHIAKIENAPEVVLWGTGWPRREALYVDDAADALLDLLLECDSAEPVNVGTGADRSIAEYADVVRNAVRYEGEIEFDAAMPDGAPRKLLDDSKFQALNTGWVPRTRLVDGVGAAYRDFLRRYG